MMTASEAAASVTSFSVIAPTPRWMIRRSTSSPTSILSSASSSASTEPDTSPLRMRLSWCRPCSSPASPRARPACRGLASAALRSRACRCSAICRATRSSSTTRKLSPAPGTEVKPSTCTGRAGPASSTVSPCSSSMARTRPKASPATIESPTRSVPRWTSTVATGPRPRSRWASIATPWASWSALARRSSAASAVSRIASSSCVDVRALLGRDVDEHRLAAVLLGHQAVLGELPRDLRRVGAFLVDLVDRDHDRHVGRLRVVERLDRLRLHAVVGRDHEHRDVGDLAHRGHAWR